MFSSGALTKASEILQTVESAQGDLRKTEKKFPDLDANRRVDLREHVVLAVDPKGTLAVDSGVSMELVWFVSLFVSLVYISSFVYLTAYYLILWFMYFLD